MKRIFILFSLVIIAQNIFSQERLFNNKVLSFLNDRYCYYLAINISSEKFTGPIVIENDDLFLCLSMTKNITRKEYTILMNNLLTTNKSLKIGDIDLQRWNFYKVQNRPTVMSNARKGRDFFLKTYFDGYYMKDGISRMDKYLIIYILFKWNIATKINCESGSLVYSK